MKLTERLKANAETLDQKASSPSTPSGTNLGYVLVRVANLDTSAKYGFAYVGRAYDCGDALRMPMAYEIENGYGGFSRIINDDEKSDEPEYLDPAFRPRIALIDSDRKERSCIDLTLYKHAIVGYRSVPKLEGLVKKLQRKLELEREIDDGDDMEDDDD